RESRRQRAFCDKHLAKILIVCLILGSDAYRLPKHLDSLLRLVLLVMAPAQQVVHLAASGACCAVMLDRLLAIPELPSMILNQREAVSQSRLIRKGRGDGTEQRLSRGVVLHFIGNLCSKQHRLRSGRM